MWARGDYTQVGERLLPMGAALLDACERAVGGLTATRLVDAACGVGNVALQAAARGATVTGVDLTPEVLALAADRADRAGHQIDWVAGDLADPATADRATSRGPADVVASCAGHAFVPDTAACTAAIAQMLRSGGLFAYTAWERWPDDPFGRPLAPYVSVCSPDRMPFAWADEQVAESRLAPFFDDVRVEHRRHDWEFASARGAADWVLHVSPLHVAVVEGLTPAERAALRGRFVDAFTEHLDGDGAVRWSTPYVLVTARRR